MGSIDRSADVGETLMSEERAGRESALTRDDSYPDARPRLEALRASGFRIGIAGNQPVQPT